MRKSHPTPNPQAADLASRLNTEGERAAKLARENRQLNDSTTLEKQSAQLVRPNLALMLES